MLLELEMGKSQQGIYICWGYQPSSKLTNDDDVHQKSMEEFLL